ncbi:MAG: LamB/YcsF family protein [Candidatus Competibacterales bacterium]
MTLRVNLNADLGEGFGAYDIGDDTAMLSLVKSANVACGFHAGDPLVMQRVVMAAKQQHVSVGAHPGFNDLWGFGRRPMTMKPVEVEYLVAYQIGALQAMACYAGLPVTHVKAHGALNNLAADDLDLALAIGRAIKTVDRRLIHVALANSKMEQAARELDLPVAREAFVDRHYEDDGNLSSRRHPDAVIKDPDLAAQRAVAMVRDQAVVARSGKVIPTPIDTLCVHGDEPTAVAVARAAREALLNAGIEIVPLPDLPLS